MDVADLLDDVKDLVWQGEGHILSDRPIAIVVVAQTSLLVAQASSPARLPDWFPKYGGNEVTAFARDVVANAGASLKSSEARISDLSAQLYRLDYLASRRFAKLLAADSHHGLQLWDSLLKSRSGASNRQRFLERWSSELSLVDRKSTRLNSSH